MRKMWRLHLGFNSSCSHCHINEITVHRDPNPFGNAAEHFHSDPGATPKLLHLPGEQRGNMFVMMSPAGLSITLPWPQSTRHRLFLPVEAARTWAQGFCPWKNGQGGSEVIPWKSSRAVLLRSDCRWGRLMVGLDLEGLFQPWGFCDEGLSSATSTVWMPVLRYLKCACSCDMYWDPCWRKEQVWEQPHLSVGSRFVATQTWDLDTCS